MFNIELPEGFEDAVNTNVDIHFDWRDRLKVLIGYTVTVKTETFCQHSPGLVRADSMVIVWKPKRRGVAQGYGHEQPTEGE
jgi:hypothetical protein